MTFRIENC